MKIITMTMRGLVVALLAAGTTLAAPVDLSRWTAESYPAIVGFGAGVWTVSPGGDAVIQSVNGQPTLFYSDFNAQGLDVQGGLTVVSGADNDYVGFALGFRPGDTANSAANFLLVDWKQQTQAHDFGSPSATPGSTASAGLAVSRVTGVPTADEFWGHTNFASHPAGGVTELARGLTLGNTGWEEGVEYDFRFLTDADTLQVYVNGALELEVSGSFSDGRFAFYNFSQSGAAYRDFTTTPITDGVVAVIPAPAALPAALLGVVGVLLGRRRRGRG